jgi:hypothetical protein
LKLSLREKVAELRWLAKRLELLGGPPESTPESHAQALTRAMLAQAIRVIAAAIEKIENENRTRGSSPSNGDL